jgi:hypothetical protein
MELEFKFTKEEAQKILNALLKEPYAVIFDIVDKFFLR